MRISRSTGAFSGVLIALLAIWGGIVPFVGPYFHYSFGSNATWHYSSNRLWLDIVPAVVALIGGLILLSSGHRVRFFYAVGALIAALAAFALGRFVTRPALTAEPLVAAEDSMAPTTPVPVAGPAAEDDMAPQTGTRVQSADSLAPAPRSCPAAVVRRGSSARGIQPRGAEIAPGTTRRLAVASLLVDHEQLRGD